MATDLGFTVKVKTARSPLLWGATIFCWIVFISVVAIIGPSLQQAGYSIILNTAIFILLWIGTGIGSFVIGSAINHSLLTKEFCKILNAQGYREVTFSSWDHFTANKDGLYIKGVVVTLNAAPEGKGVRYRVIEYK